MRPIAALALAGALLCSSGPPAGAQESSRRIYAFTDPTAIHSVIVRVSSADIEVVGADRDDVQLDLELLGEPVAADGWIPSATNLLEPSVGGNTMRFESPRNTQRLRLRLEVPRELDLEVWGSNGGQVVVRGVQGRLTIENSNAGVTLDRVAGSALVNTSNGNIEGAFLSVTAGAPMSFITSNGAIDLTFPSDLRADVVLETDNAGFESDFTIEPDARGARAPLPPDRRRVAGKIHGGGPLFRLQSENAPILIRRPAAGT